MRSTKKIPVLSILNEPTSYFRLPKRITTDRGTAFTSKLFEEYYDRNYIQHIKTAVRTPRANNKVERAKQLTLSHLRTSTKDVKDWNLMHEI